jgi:enoyl-CoA hydratase
MAQYQTLTVSTPVPSVCLVQFNRPKALNSLNGALFSELTRAFQSAQEDDAIAVIVLTGNSYLY